MNSIKMHSTASLHGDHYCWNALPQAFLGETHFVCQKLYANEMVRFGIGAAFSGVLGVAFTLCWKSRLVSF